MNKADVRPIPNAGFFTAFVHDFGIDCLIRSSDWYKLPPIQRYLYNMCATVIRMEDAKTETRVYSYLQFDHMRELIERSASQEWEVAFEAWMTYGTADHHFGVVHLDQEDGRRGDLLIGDSPEDYAEFVPDDVVMCETYHWGKANPLAKRSDA